MCFFSVFGSKEGRVDFNGGERKGRGILIRHWVWLRGWEGMRGK